MDEDDGAKRWKDDFARFKRWTIAVSFRPSSGCKPSHEAGPRVEEI